MTDHDQIREILRTFAARRNLLNQAEDALREMQKYGDDLIPALTTALKYDPDDEVRLLVMRLFQELGADSEPALPALIRLLEDGNRLVRLAAAGTVARFGKKAIGAVPILESWIGSEDGFTHVTALGTILKIDPSKASTLLPVLIDALDLDGMEQAEAIGQLEKLGEMATDAVPSLKRLLKEHSTVSLSASDAIHGITGDPTDGVKVGIALLQDEEWLQRYVGCEHLGLLKEDAQPAILSLKLIVLDDENEAVRNRARVALEEIGV